VEGAQVGVGIQAAEVSTAERLQQPKGFDPLGRIPMAEGLLDRIRIPILRISPRQAGFQFSFRSW
jgi:hypothetical protein